MTPYQLTVIDGLSGVLHVGNLILFLTALGAAIAGGFIIDTAFGSKDELARGHSLLRTAKKLAVAFSVVMTGSVFVPSAKDLRDAYVMTEVAKLATADNAKQTAEALLQRIDRLLELQKEKK